MYSYMHTSKHSYIDIHKQKTDGRIYKRKSTYTFLASTNNTLYVYGYTLSNAERKRIEDFS